MSVWINEEYDANITFNFSGPAPCPFDTICLKFVQIEDSVKFGGLLTENYEMYTAKLEDQHTFFFEFGTPETTEVNQGSTGTGTDSGVITGNVTTAGDNWLGPSALFTLLTALLEIMLL